MIVKQSPLELKDFIIINFNYSFKPLDKGGKEVPIQSLYKSYIIDIDFNIKGGDGENYLIYIKANINNGSDGNEKQPGYNIFIECVGIFSIGKEIDDKTTNSLINSALNMTLNHMRAFLADATANFPFGRYLLPSIDLMDLVSRKFNKPDQ